MGPSVKLKCVLYVQKLNLILQQHSTILHGGALQTWTYTAVWVTNPWQAWKSWPCICTHTHIHTLTYTSHTYVYAQGYTSAYIHHFLSAMITSLEKKMMFTTTVPFYNAVLRSNYFASFPCPSSLMHYSSLSSSLVQLFLLLALIFCKFPSHAMWFSFCFNRLHQKQWIKNNWDPIN